MAILHFNVDSKKYSLEFLPKNQVKIIQLNNKNKCIVAGYFPDTKIKDFVEYIRNHFDGGR